MLKVENEIERCIDKVYTLCCIMHIIASGHAICRVFANLNIACSIF